MNIYTYCINNPIRYWDPTGHYAIYFDDTELTSGNLVSRYKRKKDKEYIMSVIKELKEKEKSSNAKGTGEVEQFIKNNGIGVLNIENRKKQVDFLNSILYGAVSEYFVLEYLGK